MKLSIDGYEPAHLSWSTFDSYRSCGKRFQLQKVEMKEQRPNWSSVGGSALHTVVEGIEKGEVDLDSLDAEYTDAFVHHIGETLRRSPSFQPDDWYVSNRGKKNAEWWREEGPRMVQRWIDWRQSTGWSLWETPTGEPGVEVGLNFTLPGDIPIKGYIDSVWVLPGGGIAPLDVKSGRIPEFPEQLGLYAVGMEILFGIRPQWGYFWDAAKGTHGQPISLDVYTPEYMADLFGQMIAGANAGVFIPKPQMACQNWCGVARFCPAVNGELATRPTRSV